jgi:hypothetical protein
MLTATAGKAYTKRYFNEHWREDCGKLDAINEKAANGGEFVKTADLNFHDNRGSDHTGRGRRHRSADRRDPRLVHRKDAEDCRYPTWPGVAFWLRKGSPNLRTIATTWHPRRQPNLHLGEQPENENCNRVVNRRSP